MRDSIQGFFSAIVDINRNWLVLAVSTFIHNDWFTCCSEIYSFMADLVIFPMMELLGIDKKGDQRSVDRTWAGVRTFLENKLGELEELMVEKKEHGRSGRDKLVAVVIEEIVDAVKNQLSKTDYFTIRPDEEVCKDMKYAPLTNLGCESEFSKLDHRIKVSGGSTSIQTLSRKNLLVSAGLLVDSEFESQTEDDRNSRWKWA